MPAADLGPTPGYLEAILGFTAFAAGSVDVLSFTRLGGTLASAMTGNLAFLGLYTARGAFPSALGAAIALAAFVLGGVAATLTTNGRDRLASLRLLLPQEVLSLALVAVLWFTVPHPPGGGVADALVALLAFGMGLQSIVGKRINLSNIPTVVFTSTLVNIVIALTERLMRHTRRLPTDTKRQIVSFLLYLFGAFAAGLLVATKSNAEAVLPAAAVLGAAIAAVAHRRTNPAPVEPAALR